MNSYRRNWKSAPLLIGRALPVFRDYLHTVTRYAQIDYRVKYKEKKVPYIASEVLARMVLARRSDSKT